MTEYTYKGCKIDYTVAPSKHEQDFYEATGQVSFEHVCDEIKSQLFRTEFKTKEGVIQEIKKMMEKHVDFELDNFIETQGEKGIKLDNEKG